MPVKLTDQRGGLTADQKGAEHDARRLLRQRLIFSDVLRGPLLCVAVEDPGHGPEEDRADDRPEGGHVVMFQDRLQAGEANPADQDDHHDRGDHVGPGLAGKDLEGPFQVRALLEEWEGPNQEEVREGRGDVPHVGQNQVELVGSGAPKGDQEDEDGHDSGLHPHRISGHAHLVQAGHLLWPEVRVGTQDKGLQRRVDQHEEGTHVGHEHAQPGQPGEQVTQAHGRAGG